MVKNYLKIALRNLWKYKEYSLINILGLAIGMAVCILIFLWVQDELSFDRFHENCDNLFRVVTEGHYTEQVIRFSATPAQLGQVMKDELPEIVNAARLGNTGRVLVRYKDNIFYENQIYFADPSIFDRKILVFVQFTLSIILIIGTIVIYKQMNYIRNKNLGFDKELMVCLPIRGNMGQNYEAIKAEILQNPNITGVTAGSGMPAGPIGSEWGQIDWEGKDPEAVIPMRHIAVDYDYLEVFGMKIVQGRNFSKEFSTDTLNFILNEAAVKATGLDSPIGKRFYLLFRNGTIVGIVKNFHLFSLRREINPVIIRMVPHRFWRYIFVRLNPNQHDMFTTMNFLENIWKNYMPDYPFEYEFLDDRIDQLYRTEQRISTIFRYFTFLTMFVACLGLFGLASCTAEQRTKEIGIRKVLGARITVIVLLLTKEFTKLILFANLIAWPVAYYAMNKWLQNFAYRTNIGWLTFILAGILVLVIALITVSYQSIKAAVANPVESLRYE